MRQLLFKSTLCLLLAAVGASASTILCADQTNDATGVGGGTIDKYIALGASGCMIGNLLFSNFAYSYSLGTDAFYVSGPKGTGTQQNANVVNVAVNTLNDQFSFGANWVVNHYQTANLSISFTVTAPPVSPVNTLQSIFTATQGGTQNGGPTNTTTAVCTGGTCGPTTFTNQIKTITPTTGPLQITNTVFMNANGSTNSSTNNYHLSILSDQFKTTAPPGVPEPVTYVATGAGLAVLAFFRKRSLA